MSDTKLSAVWEEILDKMRKNLTEPTCNRWLRPLKPIDMTDKRLKMGVPNSISKDWITEHYMPLFEQAVFDTLHKDLKIELVIVEMKEQPKKTAKQKNNENMPIQEKLIHMDGDEEPSDVHSSYEAPSPIAPGDASSLNNKYTFDTFVTGKSNQFAHAAALAVANSPGKTYNPFFMYGGVGLGKTHLMHAIGHHIIAHHPEMRVLYVSSEKFTNELINSIRDGDPELFRQKYRNIDVLLVDDIQFLTGKQSTQEEFFHTFNTLRDAEKQIILSSDRPPREVKNLEERLRSRFEWGLTTDIQAPDFETRIAILKKKSLLDKIEVPNDVLVYIASRIDSNIRELEGALTKVIAYASLNNRPITSDLMAEALQDVLPNNGRRDITIELIKDVVARHFNIKVDDLVSKTRTREIAYPRQIAMFLGRELTQLSLPQIAAAFNKNDHTTVIHAHKKIRADCESDVNTKNTIETLTEQLKKL